MIGQNNPVLKIALHTRNSSLGSEEAGLTPASTQLDKISSTITIKYTLSHKCMIEPYSDKLQIFYEFLWPVFDLMLHQGA